MNKRRFSVAVAAGRGHRLLPRHGSGCLAGFSFLGFWQGNKPQLLLAAVVLAVVVVFVMWIFRRSRREVFPEVLSQAPEVAAAPEMDLTQAEPQEAMASRPAPSPGIHGKIEVVIGSQQISSYLITDNPLLVGRDPAQSLVVIQEPIVSKLHCQIFARGGKVFVKDLHSTNGVYLNDEKIDERELKNEDIVFLGKKGTVKIIYHQ
jgi:hypothetical protein